MRVAAIWPPRIPWEGLAIFLGFALTLSSLIAGQTYLEPVSAVTSIDSQIAAKRVRVKALRAANALNDFASQLGSAVFSVQPGPNRDPGSAATLGQLEHRSLVHRHDGARAFLAALGLTGEIDFPSVSAAYEKLVAAESRDFTFENFSAANVFIGDISNKVVKDWGEETLRITALQKSRFAARREADQRSLILVLVSTLGSSLIFHVTMKATASARAADPAPKGNEPVADLLAAALTETRARIARASGSLQSQSSSPIEIS
jgi:hypothetical protein